MKEKLDCTHPTGRGLFCLAEVYGVGLMAANAPENVRRLLAWQKKNPPGAEQPEPVSVPRPKVVRGPIRFVGVKS